MRINKDRLYSILVISPSLVFLSIFVYGFIGWTFRVSFSNWNSIVPDWTFAGFQNYIKLFKNTRFQIDIFNNIFFIIFFISFCVIGGFFLAVMLEKPFRGESFFRTIYLYPLCVSFVVSGIVWRWIFAPGTGINVLINQFLSAIGIDKFQFNYEWFITTKSIGHFNLALIPIIIAALWQYTGYVMAMFLAGLRGIPEELREAARMDGASEARIYSSIVIPILKPVIFSIIVILAHISLRIFDLVYIMTGSGPAFVTDFPAIFMFETTFRGNKFAQGSAIAVIMLLLVLAIIIPYLINTLKSEKKYGQ